MNEISIDLIEMLDLLLQKGISTFPHTITHSNIIQFNHPQWAYIHTNPHEL